MTITTASALFFFMALFSFFFIRQGGFDHNRALHSLALELTADVIGIVDGAMEVIGISSTASAAIESGKAFLTFFLGIDVAALEFVLNLRMNDSRVHVAQKEFLVSDELMAGIKIAPGGNCQILGS